MSTSTFWATIYNFYILVFWWEKIQLKIKDMRFVKWEDAGEMVGGFLIISSTYEREASNWDTQLGLTRSHQIQFFPRIQQNSKIASHFRSSKILGPRWLFGICISSLSKALKEKRMDQTKMKPRIQTFQIDCESSYLGGESQKKGSCD